MWRATGKELDQGKDEWTNIMRGTLFECKSPNNSRSKRVRKR